jgi:hypothetical protein
MEYVQSVHKVSEAVESLKERFGMKGYCHSIGAKFYVQSRDANGMELFNTEEIRNNWDVVWQEQNRKFKAECDANPNFIGLKDCMFAIFNSNHRFYAWSMVCAKFSDELKYHPWVECVILKGDQASMVELEQAMHGVNK